MVRAYVGLGANLGDPRRQVESALGALGRLGASRRGPVSPPYRSAPLGPADQPDYLNAVVVLDTVLAPLPLLDALQAIESAAGRIRGRRWGPRRLDLDLLLYGDRRIDEARLTVPHPGLATRAFVLYPLVDLCGRHFRLPCGTDLGTLLDSCPGPTPARQGWMLSASGDEADRDRDDG